MPGKRAILKRLINRASSPANGATDCVEAAMSEPAARQACLERTRQEVQEGGRERVLAAVLGALTPRRLRALLDPSDPGADSDVDRLLNTPLRDGQQLTAQTVNLILTRLADLETVCECLAHALVEALHPARRAPRSAFFSSAAR